MQDNASLDANSSICAHLYRLNNTKIFLVRATLVCIKKFCLSLSNAGINR